MAVIYSNDWKHVQHKIQALYESQYKDRFELVVKALGFTGERDFLKIKDRSGSGEMRTLGFIDRGDNKGWFVVT